MGLPAGNMGQHNNGQGDFLAINGTFKAPTLRNVDKRPSAGFVKAYMHNGFFKSLPQVVHFYNTRNLTSVPGEVLDFTKSTYAPCGQADLAGAGIPLARHLAKPFRIARLIGRAGRKSPTDRPGGPPTSSPSCKRSATGISTLKSCLVLIDRLGKFTYLTDDSHVEFLSGCLYALVQ